MCGKYIKFKLATLFVYIYIRSLPKTDKNADYCHIKKVYIGALEPKYGAVCSKSEMFSLPSNHKVEYETGILQEECTNIIKEFFKELRGK